MADDNIGQRLAAIEAALPTLATKADVAALVTDVAALATNIEKINQELLKSEERDAAMLAEIRNMYSELRFVTGMTVGMARAGASLSELVSQLIERVERLEKRGEA